MIIERASERCIACLKEPPFVGCVGFTREHIIPEALGGILTSDCLCKGCNSHFGKTFEARAKSDPAIRMAIYHLRYELPDLYRSMEHSLPYKIRTEIGLMPGFSRDGEIKGATVKLEDGSLMSSGEQTDATLRKLMKKRGYSAEYIEDALKRLEQAPEEVEYEVAPGIPVTKRIAFDAGPDLTAGDNLNHLVPLKIAYETAALAFGSPVLADLPPLREMRRALRAGDATAPVFRVDELMSRDRKYEPVHGIMWEGNKPTATFRVMLFGYLSYRVHLPNLTFDLQPFGYTHEIDTGRDYCNLI